MVDFDTGSRGNRLLVIDDDPAVADVIGRIARRSGYDVIVTADAADFRQRARSWNPAIIILDLAMPDSDGIELLRHLADQHVSSRILIVSGHDQKVLDAAQRLGASRGLNMMGVLRKPMRAAELTDALRRIDQDINVVTVPRIIEGLDSGEVFLEFQPKIDLRTRQPVGVETLLRWSHPEIGLIPPATFISVVEESHLIHRLTEWVLDGALSQHKAWAADGLHLTVAVNLSPRNLDELDLADLVMRCCRRHEVDPSWLILELTESAATRRVEATMDTLTRLRLKGVGLSIDDFGTGYSSLMQLQRLPFSEVKIDKTFVIDCATSKDNAVIVSAIIDLTHRLGLRAVAEGVETTDALHFVSEANCDAAQGYLFCRPILGSAIPEWFRTHPVVVG